MCTMMNLTSTFNIIWGKNKLFLLSLVIAWNDILELVKLQSFVTKCCQNKENIALRSLHVLYSVVCITHGKSYHFRGNFCGNFSSRNRNMCKIWKLRTAIFCILQHFATKLCNFANFTMLFLGMARDLPRSKFCLFCKLFIAW